MNREMVAALRRAEESAKTLKTTPNIVSDPTMASLLDNILDSCSIGLSILATAEASPHSNKKNSREEAFKHYRDDSPTLILDDGFSWKKYGRKIIRNSPHKRSYYYCRYREHSNCKAKKKVQKIQDDPPVFRTTYYGEHTCKNVVVQVPVENANMIQFDSHDEAITTDRQKTVDHAANQEEEQGKYEQFLGVDFPALTKEDMEFLDDIFV